MRRLELGAWRVMCVSLFYVMIGKCVLRHDWKVYVLEWEKFKGIQTVCVFVGNKMEQWSKWKKYEVDDCQQRNWSMIGMCAKKFIFIIKSHFQTLNNQMFEEVKYIVSYTAEPCWFEVIGTASNTSKYWGFELMDYEHPCLPTENLLNCKKYVKR